MKNTIKIRPASLEDAPFLLDIYRYYVEQTAITFECEPPGLSEFRGRMRHILSRYPYLVLEEAGTIAGYAYAGPFVGREAYDWGCETTIYLACHAARRGLGRLLYETLEEEVRNMGIRSLYACIGTTQEADERLSQNSADFHAHLGYLEVGRFPRCGYKFDRWYDMIWMEKKIGLHQDRPFPVRRSSLASRFFFRPILQEEALQAAQIEQTCFPPKEACSPQHMEERVQAAPETFLVAVDRENGRIAGFLNGIATEEETFRDEFFTDASLHTAQGRNVMLAGLDVLPAYRSQGLARELVQIYSRREQAKGRARLVLTCLEEKVPMYENLGFWDLGLSASVWGGETWHEMEMKLR